MRPPQSTFTSNLIGSHWKPGQVFCNLHFTLAIANRLKSVMAMYQTTIGSQKLFPKTVGFEMELDGQIIVLPSARLLDAVDMSSMAR